MKKHAFIFDMDGVLIDSQPVHYDADLETLAHFGVQLVYNRIEYRNTRFLFQAYSISLLS